MPCPISAHSLQHVTSCICKNKITLAGMVVGGILLSLGPLLYCTAGVGVITMSSILIGGGVAIILTLALLAYRKIRDKSAQAKKTMVEYEPLKETFDRKVTAEPEKTTSENKHPNETFYKNIPAEPKETKNKKTTKDKSQKKNRPLKETFDRKVTAEPKKTISEDERPRRTSDRIVTAEPKEEKSENKTTKDKTQKESRPKKTRCLKNQGRSHSTTRLHGNVNNLLDAIINKPVEAANYLSLNPELVNKVIDNNSNTSSTYGELPDAYPIFYVTNPDLLKAFINLGADLNVVSNGKRLLTKMIEKKQTELIKVMLKADVNVIYFDLGKTPLHYIVENGMTDLIESFIDKGAKIDKKEQELGNTPLHLAVFKGDVEMIKKLIDEKADVNVENKKGSSVLQYTLKLKGKKKYSIIEFLIDKGTFSKKVKDDFITAVLVNSDTGVLETLIKRKFVDEKDPDLMNKMADLNRLDML